MVDIADNSYKRVTYLCDVCSRILRPQDEPDEYQWWLISSPPLGRRFMVRCPRHVTEWAMRVAGVPRNKTFRRWLKQAHEHDAEPRTIDESIHPYVDPWS